jgi:hypothetical protein
MEQNGLGAFLEVMEYLGIATVLINCVFMYWFRVQFITIVKRAISYLNFMYPESV